MPFGNIKQIQLRLWTSNLEGSSTSGRVYLGIAGREFAVKSANNSGQDFVFHPDGKEFVFGDDADNKDHNHPKSTVARPEDNDPSRPMPCQVAEIPHLPLYLRLVPSGSDDNWHLHRADVNVRYQPDHSDGRKGIGFGRLADQGGNHGGSLWLGTQRGLYLYFLTEPLFDE